MGAVSVGEWKRVFGFIKIGNVATVLKKIRVLTFHSEEELILETPALECHYDGQITL